MEKGGMKDPESRNNEELKNKHIIRRKVKEKDRISDILSHPRTKEAHKSIKNNQIKEHPNVMSLILFVALQCCRNIRGINFKIKKTAYKKTTYLSKNKFYLLKKIFILNGLCLVLTYTLIND